MRYWTIMYPGEVGQLVRETFSEDQIIESYYRYWKDKMILAGRENLISKENCLDDWKIIAWAYETDEYGDKL